MHDDTTKPNRRQPPASPVLPLTRPVVAVALGALVGGGASLFLAGLATGLGLGGSLHIAAVPQPPAAAESPSMAGGAVAAEPQRRLVVGDLAPLAPPPMALPEPAVPEPAVPEPAVPEPLPEPLTVAAEAVVAAVAPSPPLPAVPPRKPEAPVLAAVAVAMKAPPDPASDSPLDSLENVAAAQRYAVQTGAYSVPENADRRAEELRKLGYAPYKTDHVTSRGTPLTIVYAGRFDSRERARTAAEALQKAGIDSRLTALAD